MPGTGGGLVHITPTSKRRKLNRATRTRTEDAGTGAGSLWFRTRDEVAGVLQDLLTGKAVQARGSGVVAAGYISIEVAQKDNSDGVVADLNITSQEKNILHQCCRAWYLRDCDLTPGDVHVIVDNHMMKTKEEKSSLSATTALGSIKNYHQEIHTCQVQRERRHALNVQDQRGNITVKMVRVIVVGDKN